MDGAGREVSRHPVGMPPIMEPPRAKAVRNEGVKWGEEPCPPFLLKPPGANKAPFGNPAPHVILLADIKAANRPLLFRDELNPAGPAAPYLI